MLKKEVFNKFIKLLSAGMVPTSSKDFHGLGIDDLLNLPIVGTEVFDLDSEIIPLGDLTHLEQIGEYQNLNDGLIKFINIIEKIENMLEARLDKKPIKFTWCIQLKGCHLIKDGCIIDKNTRERSYELKLDPDTGIDIIKDSLVVSIKELYIDDVTESTFENYPLLNIIKQENVTTIQNDDGSPIFSDEATEIWINDLLGGIKLYIDYEFSVYENELNLETLVLDKTFDIEDLSPNEAM